MDTGTDDVDGAEEGDLKFTDGFQLKGRGAPGDGRRYHGARWRRPQLALIKHKDDWAGDRHRRVRARSVRATATSRTFRAGQPGDLARTAGEGATPAAFERIIAPPGVKAALRQPRPETPKAAKPARRD
jgi:hypothetical protein